MLLNVVDFVHQFGTYRHILLPYTTSKRVGQCETALGYGSKVRGRSVKKFSFITQTIKLGNTI